MSNKSSEKSDLSEATWAAERLQKDVAPFGSVGGRIRAAARALRWKHSRTRTIWYADPRASIKPNELRRITEVTGIEYGREEVRSVDQLIANAASLLERPDADFYRPFVAALRAMVGAFDRAGTAGRDRPALDQRRRHTLIEGCDAEDGGAE